MTVNSPKAIAECDLYALSCVTEDKPNPDTRDDDSKEHQYKDRINIIHACDFDAAYPAYHFFRKHSVKMVYDIYDYYIDSHSIPLILSRVIEKSENRIINTADCVILCTEERREQIRKTSPKKVIVVHNSPDVEIIPNSEELYDYSYCGALVDRRLISEIVDDYQNNQDFKIAIAGGGKHLQKVQQLKARFCNVSYLGVIPYDEVISIEAKTKVLSAMYEPVIRNHKLCAPNKFYEAMALGKPIIVCRGTGIDKIVEDNRIGVAINYNACEFYTELRRLINNPQLRKSMGENARNLYERDYKWTVMKQRLIAMYDEL